MPDLSAFLGGGELPPIPVNEQDPAVANRLADQILSDPAYLEPQPSLVDRVLEWVGEQFGRAFTNAAGFDGGGLLSLLFVVGLVGLVTYFVYRSVQVPAPVRVASSKDSDLVYGTDAPVTADAWVEEARRLTAAAEYVGAVRCWFQAAAAEATSRRVVRSGPGTTAREIAALLEDAVGSVGGLPWLVGRFEDVWYGGGPAAEADVTTSEQVWERVRQAAADHARRVAA